MSSSEWTNGDIDRIFNAASEAVFGEGSIDDVVREIRAANDSSVWPDILLEDVIDAEYLEG